MNMLLRGIHLTVRSILNVGHSKHVFFWRCLVQQLQLNLHDTKELSGGGGCTPLFLHWKPNIRDIYQSHISKWIVKVVKTAYQSGYSGKSHGSRFQSIGFIMDLHLPVSWKTFCLQCSGGHLVCSRGTTYVIWHLLLVPWLRWAS